LSLKRNIFLQKNTINNTIDPSIDENKNTMMQSLSEADITTKIEIKPGHKNSKILNLNYDKIESNGNQTTNEQIDKNENNNKQQKIKSPSEKSSTTRKICRICYESTNTSKLKLIAPCLCIGSVKYIHEACLRSWIIASNTSNQDNLNQTNEMILDKTSCELCKFQYIINEIKVLRCSKSKACNYLEKILQLLLVTSITLSVMGYILFIIIFR
jgi:hypothetical protein